MSDDNYTGLLSQADTSTIQADLARLNEAGDQNQLNAYLATTSYTPEQLAQVTGYSASDLASAMDSARSSYTPGDSSGGFDSYGGAGGSTTASVGLDAAAAPPEDYRTSITNDLTRLESGKPEDLNAYLATTQYTPQQLAEVSGYNEDDIIKAIANAKTTYTPTQIPGQEVGGTRVNGYFSANPGLAEKYFNNSRGMTPTEYAVDHWRTNGSKAGQGIVDNGDGTFGLNELAPLNHTYVSQFNDDQLRGIAKTYMENTTKPMVVVDQMRKFGVGKEDVAYALSKYGQEYARNGDRVPDSWQVDNLISAHAGQEFGGSTKDTPAFRKLSPQEMEAVQWVRGMNMMNATGANLPGKILADSIEGMSKGYVTQREAEHAASMVRNANFWRGLDPTHSEAFEDPNWRQKLVDSVNDNRAGLRNYYDANEGKVSPFAIGGSAAGSVNAPGAGWKDSMPGLGQQAYFMAPKQSAGQTTTQARPPGGQQSGSQAVSSAINSAMAPTKVTATNVPTSQSVNQNDLGVMQKYGAEIKSDRTVAQAYDSFLRDLKSIDAMPVSAGDKAALKEMAVQKIENAIKYRTGA